MKKIVLVFVMMLSLGRSIAQPAGGLLLMPESFDAFTPFGTGSSKSSMAEVAVTGQSFRKVLLINTFDRPNTNGEYGLNANIATPLHKGDVLWISFKARCLESKRETGEAFVEVRLDQLVNGKYMWPSHLERGVSIGTNWTETSIPFIMKKDARPNEVRFVLKFDSYPQRFEMGPIMFIDYGQNTKMETLPKTVIHYDGDAPDAPWRAAAAQRIDTYRRGDLLVKVLDENGRPVQGAQIDIKLAKIDYGWGTATNSAMVLDSMTCDGKKYKDTLLKYFNKVVFENEMKSKNWDRVDHHKTIQAADWFKAHDIALRGHVMVWPSMKHSPHLQKYLHDNVGMGKAINAQILDETRVMKGRFIEWDVVNEPYVHHSIIDSLGGKMVMVDWFKLAHNNAPGVKLFLNEFTMFHEGKASDDFFDNVKFLVDNGAPIEGIGEQSHIGGTPPGIDFILNKLDKFGAFGLPIQISEFDITSDDEDFKARYLRDYFTAVFSHPSTTGILQWGFWAGSHWIPAAALWDKEWNVKPAGRVFTELVGKTWRTEVTGVTDANGMYKVRGYNGDYEVIVKKGKASVADTTTLTSKGQTLEIKVLE